MNKFRFIYLLSLLVVVFQIINCSDNPKNNSGNAADSLALASKGVPDGVVYVAPDSGIFKDPKVIQTWVSKFDDAAIEEHAWDLWGGITALTDQKYPCDDTAKFYGLPQVNLAVFTTWWSEYEVFNPPAPADPMMKLMRHTMPYHGLRQASANPGQVAPEAHGGDVISFNKYTTEFKDYVAKNKFYYLKTLCDLKKANTANVPQTFDVKKSMMLKPSFIFVDKTKPVLIPYWKGPSMDVAGTSDPDRPVSTTWMQWVLFNPTSTPVKPGTPFTTQYMNAKGEMVDTTLTQYETVGLNNFYWLTLTPSDIAYIGQGNIFTIGGITPSDLKPGNLALMVACHVTSIEFFSDWTWQTFWWSPHPAKTPPASANVKAPFTNYDMIPCYYMIGKDKKPFISQNPYLEPSIIAPIVQYDKFSRGLGVRSNCMSCHHSAAFPTASVDPNPGHMLIGSYIGSGQVNTDNPIFGPPNNRRLNTNFMWSIILIKQAVTVPGDFKRDSLSMYLNGK